MLHPWIRVVYPAGPTDAWLGLESLEFWTGPKVFQAEHCPYIMLLHPPCLLPKVNRSVNETWPPSFSAPCTWCCCFEQWAGFSIGTLQAIITNHNAAWVPFKKEALLMSASNQNKLICLMGTTQASGPSPSKSVIQFTIPSLDPFLVATDHWRAIWAHKSCIYGDALTQLFGPIHKSCKLFHPTPASIASTSSIKPSLTPSFTSPVSGHMSCLFNENALHIFIGGSGSTKHVLKVFCYLLSNISGFAGIYCSFSTFFIYQFRK